MRKAYYTLDLIEAALLKDHLVSSFAGTVATLQPDRAEPAPHDERLHIECAH